MGAAESSTEMFENALRARLAGTACVKQAIVEERMLRAQKPRPEALDLSVLKPGKNNIELLRVPESKDEPGWHGQVPITKVGEPKGTVTCRINGQDRPCRLVDVRFSLLISLVF